MKEAWQNKARAVGEENPEYLRQKIWKRKGKDSVINKIRKCKEMKKILKFIFTCDSETDNSIGSRYQAYFIIWYDKSK